MPKSGAQGHKVVFKNNDKDLFVFIQDVELYKKWKKGDTTIPLVQIVDSFQIFDTDSSSHTGIANTAPKSALSNELGTTDEDKAVRKILEEGELVGPGTASVEKNKEI